MLNQLKRINQDTHSSEVKSIAKKGLDKVKRGPPLTLPLTFLGNRALNEEKSTQVQESLNLGT
jgi:hypothetical protein